MASRQSSLNGARLAFDALAIEGGIIGADWLGRVAQLQAAAQEPADYRIPKGLEIRDEIARGWRIGQACFQEMEAGRAAGGNARVLAEGFLEALLRDALGFTSLAPAAAVTIGDRVYPVRFFALGDRTPVVVAPAGVGLDARVPELGDDQRRRTAFGLLQEMLNASDAALWGIASDGLSLRIARDNASLTRPAWIEADLARIFAEDLYPDFAALWLLAHESRFGSADAPAASFPLEVWREEARQEGTQARDRLSAGFQEALKIPGARVPVPRREHEAAIRAARRRSHDRGLLWTAPATRLSAHLPAHGRRAGPAAPEGRLRCGSPALRRWLRPAPPSRRCGAP